MKKITLLLVLFTIGFSAQSQQSYSELNNSGSEFASQNVLGNLEITRHNTNRLAVIDTFSDRTDFENAYTADCDNPDGLISEDFSSGPAGITTCGFEVSSNGDGCFNAGDLEEGFVVTASGAGGNEVVFLPAGAVGNISNLVGANSFPDYTIISFPDGDVYAVGHDVFNNTSLQADYRIYDITGNLIESFTLTAASTVSENFFGFIADEPIGRVEIEGAAEDGELFGNLLFGVCNLLSLNDNLASQVAIYPTLAVDVINIKTPASLEINEVTLFDIQGRNTGAVFSNGTVDVSNLSRGVYMMTIKTSEGTLTQKVVKK